MKIVKVTTYYKDFLSNYYHRYENIVNDSFQNQHTHLMNQRFAWSDTYANAFKNLGYDSYEIVANAIPLQKQWCKEKDILCRDIKSNVLEQLKLIQPTIVWFQDSYTFNGEFVLEIKKIVPSIKFVIGNCCSPISPQYYQSFKVFDLITVCSPYFKNLLETNHLPECIVIPHAFDDRILNEVEGTPKLKYDFLFTGSIILDQKFHNERIIFLESLLKAGIDIRLAVNLNLASSNFLLLKQFAFILTRLFKSMKLDILNREIKTLKKVSMLQYFPTSSKVSNVLKQKINDPVFGLEMFKEILSSRITFNIHGDIASNFAANMRMFEVTGMGSCLLTDWKPDLDQYFKCEEEIVTYKTFQEAKEKIEWLLANPKLMQEIALKGQKRTLERHNYKNRAIILMDKIKSKMS